MPSYKSIVSVLTWIKVDWEEWPLQASRGGDTTEAAVLGQASSLQAPLVPFCLTLASQAEQH